MPLPASTQTQLSNKNAFPINALVGENQFDGEGTSTSPADSIASVSLRHYSPDEDAGKYSQPLAIVRNIEDVNLVTYPEGVLPPKAELNANNKCGKFR
jgi:hypothetical protein